MADFHSQLHANYSRGDVEVVPGVSALESSEHVISIQNCRFPQPFVLLLDSDRAKFKECGSDLPAAAEPNLLSVAGTGTHLDHPVRDSDGVFVTGYSDCGLASQVHAKSGGHPDDHQREPCGSGTGSAYG